MRHTDVRGNDAAQRYLDHVVDDQRRGGRGHPRPVPENRGRKGELGLEGVERPLGLAFLEEAEAGVEQEQKADNRGLDIVLQNDLKQYGHFKHPRDRRPKLAKRQKKRALHHIDHGIGAVFRQAAFGLGACQARYWCRDRGHG